VLTDVLPGEIGYHAANVPEPTLSDGLRHCDQPGYFHDKHAVGPRRPVINMHPTQGSRLLSPATELGSALQPSGALRCLLRREGPGV
jgi:hypothetical protein